MPPISHGRLANENDSTGALLHHAQTRPKSAAFIFHEEVWTYERLADEAERLARGLAAHGVEPGDRVAFI